MNRLNQTQGVMAKLSRWFGRRCRERAPLAPPRTRLRLEVLEGREVPATMSVGMNLESVNDWSTAWTFTDAFKTSRPWISHAYNTVTGQESWEGGGAVHVDSRGWPTQLNQWTNAQGQQMKQRLATLMFRDIGTAYPAGIYRAEWEGTGTVSWGFAATVTEQGQTGTGKNYALLQVQPSNDGIYMKISDMDASDPIRDVHLWMPDFAGKSFAGQVWQPGATFSPFHPLFLEKVAPFRTLRFMDWMETNLSDITTWTDRRPFDHASQQSGDFKNGVAPEYLVALCNELDADAWVNMPHAANDTYVRNFATLVRDTLEPGRKIYVEWSNELWNGGFGFEAFQWVTDQLGRPENANLNGDRWAFVGREAKRDFDIWSDVFAGQTDRIVRVVAGQEANSWIAEQIAGNMDGHFDAISCAAYMYVSDEDKAGFTGSTTADQVIDALIANLPTALGWIQDHRNLANSFANSLGRPISFVAYEGGPHLDSWGGTYQQPFFEAGNSPRMYDAYAQLLNGARDRGLDLFQHFNLTGGLYAAPYGAFGALQSMTQDLASAPKYRAVLEAAQAGNVARPTISVEVVSAVAQETGPVAGTLRITRTGPTDEPLTINHSLAGTASAGDYTGLPGTITFGIGESEKLLTLTPVDDSLIEGNETIVFKLGASLAYNVNTATAVLSITDNDLNTRNGLRAWYYDNANFTNRRVVQVDPAMRSFWRGDSPVLGVSPTSFSVRWVGKLKAIEAGYYTLRAFNDNGVRVWVNGQLVIDNWTTRAAGFSTARPIFLQAGQRANIRVDYFHATGLAQFRLDWRRPGQTFFSPIPYSQLWLPET